MTPKILAPIFISTLLVSTYLVPYQDKSNVLSVVPTDNGQTQDTIPVIIKNNSNTDIYSLIYGGTSAINFGTTKILPWISVIPFFAGNDDDEDNEDIYEDDDTIYEDDDTVNENEENDSVDEHKDSDNDDGHEDDNKGRDHKDDNYDNSTSQ